MNADADSVSDIALPCAITDTEKDGDADLLDFAAFQA